MAFTFLYRLGYRNMQVLQGGIPEWSNKGYPVEGQRRGAFEHRPYSPAVQAFERRLTVGTHPAGGNQ